MSPYISLYIYIYIYTYTHALYPYGADQPRGPAARPVGSSCERLAEYC